MLYEVITNFSPVVSRGLITSGSLLHEVLQVFIAIQGGKFLYTVVGVRFKKAGKIYVITSYSIHYTKLYEYLLSMIES